MKAQTRLLLPLLFSFALNTQAASPAFKTGIDYFEKAQYDQAIKQFQQALREGDNRAAVYYNLAVSEYKTGRLDDAETHFKQAAKNPRFASLSSYSLGLIATKRNQLQQAIVYFDQVEQGNATLRRRADTMIARIKNELKTTKPASVLDHTHGLATLSYGRDSNVNRARDNSPSNVGDRFTSLYASISMPFSATNSNIGFGASYFSINYDTLDTDDFSIARANVHYKTRLSDWKTRAMLSFSSSALGPDDFQTTTRLSLLAKKKLSRHTSIKFDAQFDNINSSTALYDYLQGTRQRLRAAYRMRFGDLRLDTRYRLELNNRDDLPTQSFSPTRHTLRAIARYAISRNLSAKLDAAFRSSDYPAVGINPGRSEDRFQLAARLQYRLDKYWALEAYARHINNGSSNPVFKYQRDDVYLTLSLTY